MDAEHGTGPGPTSSARRDLRIMLVEDDPLVRDLLVECIRRSGLSDAPEAFADGESAIGSLHRRLAGCYSALPNLVLLDLELPGMSGFDVLRRVRASWRTRTLPVIVLSNSEDARAVTRAYALGANCYIQKQRTARATVAALRMVKEFFGGVVTLPPQ